MKKKKIIIIDDNHSLLDCLKEALEESCYDIISMTDGRLIESAMLSLPDLLLLDIQLLNGTGYEICKAFKKNPKTQHIPVILMSADYLIEKKLCGTPYADFLLKPFGIDSLLEKISKHLLA